MFTYMYIAYLQWTKRGPVVRFISTASRNSRIGCVSLGTPMEHDNTTIGLINMNTHTQWYEYYLVLFLLVT